MKVLPILSNLIKSWESNFHGIFETNAHIDNYFITYIIACACTKPSGNWNFYLMGNICNSLGEKNPCWEKRLEICFPFLYLVLGALEKMIAFGKWWREEVKFIYFLLSGPILAAHCFRV